MNCKETPTRRGKDLAPVYSEAEMYEVKPTPRLNLPGLREIRCLAPSDGKAYWLVDCEFEKRYMGGCPQCGSTNYYALGKETKARLIHDVSVGMQPVDIRIHMPRYKCNETECGKSFMYPTEAFAENHNITSRLLNAIRSESFVMEFSLVAKLNRISDSLVEKIFDEYCVELEARRKEDGIAAPTVLGIDEKHIQKKMRGVLVNIETGELLEFLEDNSAKTIQSAIESLSGYGNIRVVTIDMANQYLGTIQKCLPDAKVVIDRYHVIQDLYKRIVTIKKKIHEYERGHLAPDDAFGAELLTQLSKNAYLFRFNKKKVYECPRRAQLMADICKHFPNLNKLRVLKETFEEIYYAQNRDEAQAKYNAWRELVKKADQNMFGEMHSLMRSMDYWMPNILNYFEPGCKYTNAAAEGLNSLVERINLKGSGYSFNRLRAKLLLASYAEKSYDYFAERVKVSKTITKKVPVNYFSTGNSSGPHYMITQEIVTDYVDSVVEGPQIASALTPPCLFDLYGIPLYKELGTIPDDDETAEESDEPAWV